MYLRTKFQVSNTILTSFRKGGKMTISPNLSPVQNKPLKNPPRLGLTPPAIGWFFGWNLKSAYIFKKSLKMFELFKIQGLT